MDDGSYNKHKNNIIICTDSFSKDDVLRLINLLTIKFNISCGIVKMKRLKSTRLSDSPLEYYYRIRINKSSIDNLIKLVKPYFTPSLYYKLGL